MCNTKQGMMGEPGGQFVYLRTLGAVCRSQNNGSAILSLPGQEPMIEKVAKYGMGKLLFGLVI
jgi:hypothetical protein